VTTTPVVASLGDLDSKLQRGDRVTLLAQCMGGR
jgi:hypothetical protein